MRRGDTATEAQNKVDPGSSPPGNDINHIDPRVPASPCPRVLSPKARLILAAALFLAWVGFLAFLALGTADPTVLSRPQFLVSTLDLIATVDQDSLGQPKTAIKVQEVHWSKMGTPGVMGGQQIDVVNLPAAEGWRGPGTYILPLVQKDGFYEVAPLPRSPGFAGTIRQYNPPRIYLETHETRAQLDSIPKPKN